MASEMTYSTSVGGALVTLQTGAAALISMGENQTGFSVPAPFSNSIVLVEDTHVAGTTHVPGIEEKVARLSEGCELRFVREKENLTDQWAIKVFSGQDCLGYVPCDCNEILARMMDGGKCIKGRLLYAEKRGSWNKLHMEVILDD